jgi:hypothetical protein
MYPHSIGIYLELMEYSLKQRVRWEHRYVDALVCQKVHTKINKGSLPPSYWNLLKDNEIFLEARGMVKVWPFWYSILLLYKQLSITIQGQFTWPKWYVDPLSKNPYQTNTQFNHGTSVGACSSKVHQHIHYNSSDICASVPF